MLYDNITKATTSPEFPMFTLKNTQDEHDHSKCVHKALEQAKVLCEKQGARLTRLRRQILELVWQSHKPLGAYTLMDMLADNSDRKRVAPPTVYRSLDFLLEQGLIHKVHSLNAYMGCSHPTQKDSEALFICGTCGHTEEIRSNSIQQAINLAASQHRFTVNQQILEVVGLCNQCKGKR